MRDRDILYLLIRGRPVYLKRVTNWRDEEKRKREKKKENFAGLKIKKMICTSLLPARGI